MLIMLLSQAEKLMMSGLSGLTGHHALWSVEEDTSTEPGHVMVELKSVKGHRVCPAVATLTNVKVRHHYYCIQKHHCIFSFQNFIHFNIHCDSEILL